MAVRLRTDLDFYPLTGESEPTWVVRDPLSQVCYRIGAEEHFLLTQFPRSQSLSDLQTRFSHKFSGRTLSNVEIQHVFADWQQHHLLLNDRKSSRSQTSAVWLNRLGRINPLVIRFRGWNPSSFLAAVTPWCNGLFAPLFLGISLLMMISAALSALTRGPSIATEVYETALLFEPKHWLLLIGFISVTKILHELGHAITCHRFGGRCYEMGVMFLAFMPCLYCNVTDAWTFPRRYQRMAVSGAGIAVDLWIASLCYWLWFFSSPGLGHTLCLLLAILGSVNSLLLNGNPLMRYDGYYLLSDWLGIPNLRTQANAQSRRLIWRTLFGRMQNAWSAPFSFGMASYGMLSGIYLWGVIFLILSGLYYFLQAWNLEVIAIMIGLTVIPAQLISSMMQWSRQARLASHERSGSAARGILVGLGFLSLLVAGLLFPFPRRIPGTGITQPDTMTRIVNQESGLLSSPLNNAPASKQMLLQLKQPDLDQQIARLQTRIRQLTARRDSILKKRAALSDGTAALAICEKLLTSLTEQLTGLTERLNQQTLVVDQDDKVIPIPLDSESSVFTVPANAFEPSQAGRLIEKDTPLAFVGSEDQTRLLVMVEQDWSQHLQSDSDVLIWLPELSGKPLHGTVSEIAPFSESIEQAVSPAHQQLIAHLEQTPGAHQAGYASLWVTLSDPERPLLWNQIGAVRLQTTPASLLARFQEFLARTF